jgi:hypothetical protein
MFGFDFSNLAARFNYLSPIAKIILVAVALYVVYMIMNSPVVVKNTGVLTSAVENVTSRLTGSRTDTSDDVYKNNPDVLAHPQMSNDYDNHPINDVQPHELLPRDGGFADSNPQGQGTLSGRNFFESGHHAGLNTQGGSMKNPNLQLRSDPVITRQDVGPWHNSTIEEDTMRRQFDIGM